MIWLSSVSEISICRGSLGAHTVTSSCEVKCWWVKFTIVSTLLFISFPFTKTASQWVDTCGEGSGVPRCSSRKNAGKSRQGQFTNRRGWDLGGAGQPEHDLNRM